MPSSAPEPYGVTSPHGPFGGELPITGVLGDQQAATVGQVCFAPGEAKNTYGTGNFLLLNTGTDLSAPRAACSPRCAIKFGAEPAVYALEGSIAVTGAAVQWLRDQLGIISGAAQSETLAARSPTPAACTSCPRSPGCSRRTGEPTRAARSSGCPGSTPARTWPAPPWRPSATRPGTWSRRWRPTRGVRLEVLKVDGGVTANDLCMQLQADILGVPVSRPWWPRPPRSAPLRRRPGHRILAGHRRAARQLARVQALVTVLDPDRRAGGYAGWRKAVQRTLDWVDVG